MSHLIPRGQPETRPSTLDAFVMECDVLRLQSLCACPVSRLTGTNCQTPDPTGKGDGLPGSSASGRCVEGSDQSLEFGVLPLFEVERGG